MSRKGNYYDNAVVESSFATLKRECVQKQTFASVAVARGALFAYIEGWYNRERLHSSLGYQSPVAYEENQRSAVKTQAKALHISMNQPPASKLSTKLGEVQCPLSLSLFRERGRRFTSLARILRYCWLKRFS